jgi:hypothetical protein
MLCISGSRFVGVYSLYVFFVSYFFNFLISIFDSYFYFYSSAFYIDYGNLPIILQFDSTDPFVTISDLDIFLCLQVIT